MSARPRSTGSVADPRWPAFYVYPDPADVPFTDEQAAAVARVLDEIGARMARNAAGHHVDELPVPPRRNRGRHQGNGS
jgi:hypothetical protein